MIDQRKKSRWELYRQNWANWRAMHPDPVKNSRRPQVQAPAPPINTRDKLKLVAWGGLILGCMYGMWPHPPPPTPELTRAQEAALARCWWLESPPLNEDATAVDSNASLVYWNPTAGFRTRAACEQARDASIANRAAYDEAHPPILMATEIQMWEQSWHRMNTEQGEAARCVSGRALGFKGGL